MVCIACMCLRAYAIVYSVTLSYTVQYKLQSAVVVSSVVIAVVCDTLYSWFVILACSKVDLILWL